MVQSRQTVRVTNLNELPKNDEGKNVLNYRCNKLDKHS